MTDLFNYSDDKTAPKAAAAAAPSSTASNTGNTYTAQDIEVLEGLEAVRKRPGMYIGGTDERAYHHLVNEISDNSMDEAVAGYARDIYIQLEGDGFITVSDNGRGIPVDPHPKFPKKSALDVILTTLHSGGKFNNKVYATAGGLHGVGISVVNALSESLVVEVMRDGKRYRQEYAKGYPTTKLEVVEEGVKKSGTAVRFRPDPEIFGDKLSFKPATIYRHAKSKAYLFRGVKIHWSCDPVLITDDTPAQETLHFPGGIGDFLTSVVDGESLLTAEIFTGMVEMEDGSGKVEWAIAWPENEDNGFLRSYCNTVHTPQGGTHESGLRSALVKGLKTYGDLAGEKKADQLTAEDVAGGAAALLSVFIPNPQFQGQTKEKLATSSASRVVENAVKDRFELWLSRDPNSANALLSTLVERAEERRRAKKQKETSRKTATRRLRLPGKLADCTNTSAEGTEIFLVEGDSAGGSAKQARDRKTQAILALRGKILNVASATEDKMRANQELTDLVQALGCGMGNSFNLDNLRYERVIIMTDADVDGAHISSLLMTFFFEQMKPMVRSGNLYLAQPPLYRIAQGGKVFYARDDAHKDELMKTEFTGKKAIEVSRFKGLGEMNPAQLKETTMNPQTRRLLKVKLPEAFEEDGQRANQIVNTLMGKKSELRFAYIQEHAKFVEELDV